MAWNNQPQFHIPESSTGLKPGPLNHQKQTWGLKFDTLEGSTWKAKCPISKAIVAGFRGKVASKNRTLGVAGRYLWLRQKDPQVVALRETDVWKGSVRRGAWAEGPASFTSFRTPRRCVCFFLGCLVWGILCGKLLDFVDAPKFSGPNGGDTDTSEQASLKTWEVENWHELLAKILSKLTKKLPKTKSRTLKMMVWSLELPASTMGELVSSRSLKPRV